MIENFHNILFPTNISKNMIGGICFDTSISKSKAGIEVRRSNFLHGVKKYKMQNYQLHRKCLEDLLSFFRDRSGKLYSFKFTDILDNEGEMIINGDGKLKNFPIYKLCKYINRRIYKPRSVYIEDVDSQSYSVCYDSGIITFENPPTTRYKVKFHFDIIARFETDNLEIDISKDGYFIKSLEIQEVII